jgi:hypothetical protein
MNNEWVTVADAAKILGVSKQAIRQRIFRDTIPHRKSPGGTVFVRITKHDPEANGESYGEDTAHMEGVGRNELIDELRDRVGFLEHQLETEQAASAELAKSSRRNFRAGRTRRSTPTSRLQIHREGSRCQHLTTPLPT